MYKQLPKNVYGLLHFINKLCKRYHISFDDNTILNIGCGDGIETCMLSTCGCKQIIGIDSLAMLKSSAQLTREMDYAIQNSSSCKKEVGDYNIDSVVLRNQDLLQYKGENRFDCIISSNVFEHIEDTVAAFERCYTLLKPKGYMFMITGPLYYSRYASHIGALNTQPWGYLYKSKDEMKQLCFAQQKLQSRLEHEWHCFVTTNKVSAIELYQQVMDAHFAVAEWSNNEDRLTEECKKIQQDVMKRFHISYQQMLYKSVNALVQKAE